MTSNDRQNLAHQQAGILRALFQKSPPPHNIDLTHAAHTLENKRRHEAANCLPETQKALAQCFNPLFEKFAHVTPYPARGGPLCDAANFTCWLKRTHQLPEQCTVESLLLRTRIARFPLKLAKSPHRLYLAFRLNSKIKLLPLRLW